MLYVAMCFGLGLLGAGWLYLALDALVNGDPFRWAWRKVRRQPPP